MQWISLNRQIAYIPLHSTTATHTPQFRIQSVSIYWPKNFCFSLLVFVEVFSTRSYIFVFLDFMHLLWWGLFVHRPTKDAVSTSKVKIICLIFIPVLSRNCLQRLHTLSLSDVYLHPTYFPSYSSWTVESFSLLGLDWMSCPFSSPQNHDHSAFSRLILCRSPAVDLASLWSGSSRHGGPHCATSVGGELDQRGRGIPPVCAQQLLSWQW